MSCSLAVVVQLFCVLRAVTSLDIDTTDGGYTNLLVTINEGVPCNYSIIENIKALLRFSSALLHRTTSGRVYFKHVIIDVPDTWQKITKARSVSRNAFGRGDVRVAISSKAHENRPFTKQVKLNSCSEGIRFSAHTSTGQNCKIRKNCQFTKDCLINFYWPTNYTVKSSIMFMPHLNNITYFCDDIKKNRKHNSLAPNKQNRFCDGMSTWEVIRQNEDFRKLPLPNMTKSMETTFEVVTRDSDLHPVVVMVLDVSGSMFMHHRLDFLKEAAGRYVRHIPDDSTQLAIIVFESTARISSCLKPVNKRTREGFIEAIQKLTYLDGTCIACGLDLALTVVPNNSREGATFVLMSDGERNTDASSLADVKHKLVAAKVKVTAISGRTVADIVAALVDATTAQSDDRVVIMRQERIFYFPTEMNFLVDDNVGNSTTVHIWHMDRDKAVVKAWLSDPHGVACDACCVDRTWLSTTIAIPGVAKAGNWTLHMTSPSSSPVGLHVEMKSRARNATAVPVTLACEVSSPLVLVPDLVIYAHLKKGDKVVRHADVVAEVLVPYSSHLSTTPLHDDGHLRGCPTKARIAKLSRGRPSGGSFHVATDIFESEIPPTRIRDLRVTDLSQGENGKLPCKYHLDVARSTFDFGKSLLCGNPNG
ncbi:hypothetical protein MTO96_024262 [Rhipicephalus appendiculatus]